MSRLEPTSVDIEVPTSDGLRLSGRLWSSARPLGLVVVAHGFGEHSGPYERIARRIVAETGAEVVAPDLRGHGRSPGRRGVVRHYDDLVSDYRAALRWARLRHPTLPLFALAHSNGGQVALRTAIDPDQDAPLDGLITSNPMLKLVLQVPKGKIGLGKLLMRFAPGVTLGAALAPEKLSRDPDLRSFYLDDPLRHGRISAPFFFGMIEGGIRMIEQIQGLTVPSLWIVGGADPIVDPKATRLAFDRIGASDKTMLLYPGMLHEPFHDRGREGVISDLVAWLRPRLNQVNGF